MIDFILEQDGNSARGNCEKRNGYSEKSCSGPTWVNLTFSGQKYHYLEQLNFDSEQPHYLSYCLAEKIIKKRTEKIVSFSRRFFFIIRVFIKRSLFRKFDMVFFTFCLCNPTHYGICNSRKGIFFPTPPIKAPASPQQPKKKSHGLDRAVAKITIK